MHTLSTAAMRETDRRCIEEIGIPGAVLMNNAGMAIFRELGPGTLGIVCGKGNNGGDGFVVARLALVAGWEVRVVLLAEIEEIQGDARLYLDVYRRLGGHVQTAPTPEAARAAVAGLEDCATLLDAILGTGAKGAVREPARSAILAWPNVHTVAVDVPSGLDADTGEAGEACIRADITVTLHAAKPGFLAPSAKPFLGQLIVADIGIPPACEADPA